MQLLYADVAALTIGVLVHAILPHRRLTGALLLPAVAGSATAIVWVALVWLLRLPDGAGGLWLAGMTAAIVAPLIAGLLLRTRRSVADESRLAAVARA